MKDQHTKIKGYRDLSQEEIDLMNEIKEAGQNLEMLCNKLILPYKPKYKHLQPDGRWVSIGKTHLQQGIMFLVRSVAKPKSF